MTMDPIPTMDEFERWVKRKAQDFDFNWQVMVRDELDKLHEKHKVEEEQLIQKLEALYQENKELDDKQDKLKREDLEDVRKCSNKYQRVIVVISY